MVCFPRERRARREWLRARFTAVLLTLLTLLAMQLGSLGSPAYACGCCALLPGDQRQIAVGRQVSVVRWDGVREQVVTSLTVEGDAERAAWIMPVPHRATVRLGDPELFGQLAAVTAPVHRTRHHFWPQDGDWPLTTGGDANAPTPPSMWPDRVGVVGRERLGPFDVARLAATDPGDLDRWLRVNGFPRRQAWRAPCAPTPTCVGSMWRSGSPPREQAPRCVAGSTRCRSPSPPTGSSIRCGCPGRRPRRSRWACTSSPPTVWNRPPGSAASVPG